MLREFPPQRFGLRHQGGRPLRKTKCTGALGRHQSRRIRVTLHLDEGDWSGRERAVRVEDRVI